MNTIYIYNKTSIKRNILTIKQDTSEGNKLQRQKILSFIYPIYNHNWRNISTIYVYITRLASNEIFSPSNKIHREVPIQKYQRDALNTIYTSNILLYMFRVSSTHLQEDTVVRGQHMAPSLSMES